MSIFRYALHRQRFQIIGVSVLACGLLVLLSFSIENGKSLPWVGFVDHWIGLLTFLVALLVWYLALRRNYRDELPNRLTVRFVLDGRELLRCEDAYLAGPGDIRAWGMQIGGQMTYDRNLPLQPYLDQQPPEEITPKDGSPPFVRYAVIFYLKDYPRPDPTRCPPERTAELTTGFRTHTLVWQRGLAEDGATPAVVEDWKPFA